MQASSEINRACGEVRFTQQKRQWDPKRGVDTRSMLQERQQTTAMDQAMGKGGKYTTQDGQH